MSDGHASHDPDLVIGEIETTSSQQYPPIIWFDTVDRLRHSGDGEAEQRKPHGRHTRVAGNGDVDIRFMGPHGEPLDQSGGGVRETSGRGQQLQCRYGARQGDRETLLPTHQVALRLEVGPAHEAEKSVCTRTIEAPTVARVDDGGAKTRLDGADAGMLHKASLLWWNHGMREASCRLWTADAPTIPVEPGSFRTTSEVPLKVKPGVTGSNRE